MMGPRPALDECYFQLQVMAEPRLMVQQSGALTITEAVDDKGNSLLPAVLPGNTMPRYSAYNGFGVSNGALSFQIRGQLRRPDAPGSTIKTLKGKIPVTGLRLAARKPLSRSHSPISRTRCLRGSGDARLDRSTKVVMVDEGKQNPTIDLSIRNLAGDRQNGSVMHNLRSAPELRLRTSMRKHRIYHSVRSPTSQTVTPAESRVKLMLIMNEGLGRPTKIRYYDVIRATTEAAFEFHDQPLP